MNKNDLVTAVASNSGLSKADAAKEVDGVFNSVTGELRRGDNVLIVGFGKFSVLNTKASVGRNPRTGERIEIPAARRPKFKAGKNLKQSVNISSSPETTNPFASPTG